MGKSSFCWAKSSLYTNVCGKQSSVALLVSVQFPNALDNNLCPRMNQILMSFYLLHIHTERFSHALRVSRTCVSLLSLPVRWFSWKRWSQQWLFPRCRLHVRTHAAEKRQIEKVVWLRDPSGMLWWLAPVLVSVGGVRLIYLLVYRANTALALIMEYLLLLKKTEENTFFPLSWKYSIKSRMYIRAAALTEFVYFKLYFQHEQINRY